MYHIVATIIGTHTGTNGTNLSIKFLLVNIPKKYKPISGPYVKPANFISIQIAESFENLLRKIIIKIRTIDIIR